MCSLYIAAVWVTGLAQTLKAIATTAKASRVSESRDHVTGDKPDSSAHLRTTHSFVSEHQCIAPHTAHSLAPATVSSYSDSVAGLFAMPATVERTRLEVCNLITPLHHFRRKLSPR